jgi:ribosomal protein S18 acetylase RimI-like enzyme
VLRVVEPTLRPATPADLPAIFRAERAYIRDIEPDQMSVWLDAVDRNLALWIANLERTTTAEIDGVPAGFVMWMEHPAPDQFAATLVTIEVFPEHRRRGLGRILLERYEQEAANAGKTVLRLGVHETNPARSLYENSGYRSVGRDDAYLLYERATPGVIPRG